MKINVEVDCTPLEARQFFGLPDVQPMQTAVMDKLQQQLMANIEKVSPEALMQSWFTFDPKIAERFQDMFVTMAGLGTGLAHAAEGQEIVAAMDQSEPAAERRLRPPSLLLVLAEARALLRIQHQPPALAAVDARAARRRPSGAGVAGLSRQRPVDGADAALSEATRLRRLRLEDGPQSRRRRLAAQRAEKTADRYP